MSSSHKVFTLLRLAIMKGFLRPGEPLVEEAIAEQIGLSRVPVREAIKRLEALDLVRRSPKRTAHVREISLEEAREIFVVRSVLESKAIDLACQVPEAIRDEAVRRLGALLDEEEKELTNDQPYRRYELNLNFHVGLVDMSGNRYLKKTLLSILDHMQLALISSPHFSTNVQRSHTQHRAILEAIGRGDAPTGKKLIHEHIQATQDNLEKAFRVKPSAPAMDLRSLMETTADHLSGWDLG